MAELGSTSFFNDANLVAYYKLEDVNDSKGTFTLTNNNTVAFNPAKYNNGGDFGASNSSKSLVSATNLGIAGNSSASFVFWFRSLENGTVSGGFQYPLIHYSQTGADRYFAFFLEAGVGSFNFGIDISGNLFRYSVGTGFGTSPQHFAIVRNITSGSATLFWNGTLLGGTTNGVGAGGANRFVLGTNLGGGGWTKGIFDDIGCFNRALSASEVNDIYVGNPPGTTAGAVGYRNLLGVGI